MAAHRDTDARRRAPAVLAAFVASLLVALVLAVAFDPGVQTVGARELVDRQDDARAFLAGDFLFVLLYAVVSPIVLWRFGRAAASRWAAAAAVLLALAGLVDLTENVLLLSATDTVSADAVDAAHGLEVPKVGLFVAGLIPAIVANWQAARSLRRGASHHRSPSRQSQTSSPDKSSGTPTGST